MVLARTSPDSRRITPFLVPFDLPGVSVARINDMGNESIIGGIVSMEDVRLPEEYLLGDEEELGITLALIPTATPGVNIGRRHYPARQAFQNGPNSGKDVFIPLQWVIGEREGIEFE